MADGLLKRLRTGNLLLDGAMCTELFRRGFQGIKPIAMANLELPNIVGDIHYNYIETGCEAIVTNTSGANRLRLERYRENYDLKKMIQGGVKLAREAARGKALVLGGMGPSSNDTELFLDEGNFKREELSASFGEVAVELEKAGVDAIYIETMISLQEAEIAVKAAKRATNIPVVCSVTFREPQKDKESVTFRGPQKDKENEFRTLWGNTVEATVTSLTDAGADALGVNCGNFTQEMPRLAMLLRKATDLPLFFKPDASLVSFDGHFSIDPHDFARLLSELLERGANAVGGCCGSSPVHLAVARDTIASRNISGVLSFRVSPDRTLKVALHQGDGSWTYADGSAMLPSMLFLVTSSKWQPILKELEVLINDQRVREEDLQRFFERHPRLLAGDDYGVVIPQATITRDDSISWRADFILAPINQSEFASVLDLKLPNLQLTHKAKGGHVTFCDKVWHAVCQLRDYGRAFDSRDVRERFKKRYRTDVYKPDLSLIAGRKWDLEWIDNIQELRKTTPVKIEDWNTVLDRLKRKYV